jgi:hypothetical protein
LVWNFTFVNTTAQMHLYEDRTSYLLLSSPPSLCRQLFKREQLFVSSSRSHLG